MEEKEKKNYRRRLGSTLLELCAAGDREYGRKRLGTWTGHRGKCKLCNRLPSRSRLATFSYRTDLRSLGKKHNKSIKTTRLFPKQIMYGVVLSRRQPISYQIFGSFFSLLRANTAVCVLCTAEICKVWLMVTRDRHLSRECQISVPELKKKIKKRSLAKTIQSFPLSVKALDNNCAVSKRKC